MLKLMDSINDVANNFKNWIVENGSNPLLWFGVVAIFIIFFAIAFKALRKND